MDMPSAEGQVSESPAPQRLAEVVAYETARFYGTRDALLRCSTLNFESILKLLSGAKLALAEAQCDEQRAYHFAHFEQVQRIVNLYLGRGSGEKSYDA